MNPELFIQDQVRQAMLIDMKNDEARWLRFLGLHAMADKLESLGSIADQIECNAIKHFIGLR